MYLKRTLVVFVLILTLFLSAGSALAQTADYQISDVKVDALAHRVRVTILADGPVKSRCFSLTDPPRLMVYMPEAILTWPAKVLTFETGIIQRIEAEQYRQKPNIVRTVVYLRRPAPFNVSLVRQKELILDIDTTERAAQIARQAQIKKHYTQAKVYYKAGEFAKAIEEFEKVLTLNPEHRKSKKYIAKAKAELKEIEVAKWSAAKRAEEEARAKEISQYYDLGIKNYKERKFGLAIDQFKKVLALNPEHKGAKKYIGRAKAELEAQARRKAKVEAAKKARAKAQAIEKHYNIGRIYYKNGKLLEALEEFDKVLALAPEHRGAIKYVGKAGAQLERIVQEKRLLEEAQVEAARKAAEIRAKRLAYEEAQRKAAEAARAIKEKARRADQHYKTGRDYYAQSKFSQAISEFESALSLNPQHAKALYYLARAKGKIERIEEVKRLEAQRRAQREIEERAEAYYDKGRKLYKEGKLQEATREFKEALVLNPKHRKAAKYIEEIELRVKRLARQRELAEKRKLELEARRRAELEAKRIAVLEAEEREARQVEAVSVEALPKKTRIIITSDSPIKYSHFILSEPPRLVVDLANAYLMWPKKALKVEHSVVEEVRAGQYMERPPIARVVIDLVQPIDYDIEAKENQVIVDVVNPLYIQRIFKVSLEELPDKSLVTITADSPVRYTSFNLLEPPCVVVDIYNSQIVWPEKELVVAKGVIKKIRSGQFEADIARVVVDLNQSITYRTTSVGNDIVLEINQPPIPALVEAPPEKPEELLVSMDFKDADISSVLRILARQARINVIAGPEVTGKVTVSFRDVTIEEALTAILRVHGYTYTKENTVYRVTKLGKPPEIETATRIFELNYAQAPMIKTMLTEADMLSRDEAGKVIGKIIVDVRSNTLMIIDTPVRLDEIGRMISELDIKPRQVAIESKIVEIGLDELETLGIDWSWAKIKDVAVDTSVSLLSKGGLSLAYGTLGVPDFAMVLSGLEKMSDLTVLSNPRVTTLDHETADINVTEIVAYWTTTEYERVVTGEITRERVWQEKEYGVSLSVTPHIGKDDYIIMKVHPVVSTYRWVGEETENPYPAIMTREATANVLIKSGDTLVIGGLISERESESTTGVPVLKNIPILGALFRSSLKEKKQTELIIFVTPHIVKEEEEVEKL